MPPIGFMLPLVSAVIAGAALVPEARSLAPLPPVAVSAKDTLASTLSLPPFSDAVTAQTTFSDHPLLAENRQNPQMPPTEPIEVKEVLEEPAEVEVVPEAPPMPPLVKLTGHMLVNGQNRVLLQNVEDGSEIWVGLGDRIGAWTLVEITQESVELLMGEEVITIKLFE